MIDILILISVCASIAVAVLFAVTALVVSITARYPVDRDEDGEEANERIRQIVEATNPAPLDRPHIRANTAYGSQVE